MLTVERFKWLRIHQRVHICGVHDRENSAKKRCHWGSKNMKNLDTLFHIPFCSGNYWHCLALHCSWMPDIHLLPGKPWCVCLWVCVCGWVGGWVCVGVGVCVCVCVNLIIVISLHNSSSCSVISLLIARITYENFRFFKKFQIFFSNSDFFRNPKLFPNFTSTRTAHRTQQILSHMAKMCTRTGIFHAWKPWILSMVNFFISLETSRTSH